MPGLDMAVIADRRVTSTRLIIGLALVALISVAVIDVVRTPTPDPFDGPWHFSYGKKVPSNNPLTLAVYRGHGHCGWRSAFFMEMAWPPGTEAPRVFTAASGSCS
ncbi:MAG: hypothetical protein ACRD1T_13235 [Acidimicrobiia bacterium]